MNSKAVLLTVVVLFITGMASGMIRHANSIINNFTHSCVSVSDTGDPIGRIIGGVPISIEQVPYQVSLQIIESDGYVGHFCGGSIISDKYILTASHCLE